MKKFLFFFLFETFALRARETELKFKGKHSLACYRQCESKALYDIESFRKASLTAIDAAGDPTHRIRNVSLKKKPTRLSFYSLKAMRHCVHALNLNLAFWISLSVKRLTMRNFFHHILTKSLNPSLSNQNLIERN